MKKTKIISVLTTIVLCIIAVFTLFPIYIAVLNSFKTQMEIGLSVLSFPKDLSFNNYTFALGKMHYINVVYNTFYLTVVSVIGIIVVSSLAGYKLAKTSGKLSGFIFILFTSSMLVPFSSVMLPLYKMAKFLHLSGTKTGLTVIYMGLGINLAIFLYHGFSKGIPTELEEAALIDGCNEFQMFYKIIFPLLKPITATIAILDVLWIWNDFMLPLVMISDPRNNTIVLEARGFVSAYIIDWPSILAALLCSMIPVIIFYAIFQKNIVKGITAGAVKG